MKKSHLLIFFIGLSPLISFSQEEKKSMDEKKPMEYSEEIKAANQAHDMTEAEMMEKWMEMNALGEQHAEMAKTIGHYTYKSQSWMSPDADPMISEGTTEIRSFMDGRYLMEEHKGMSMGIPFHGLAIQGYDKVESQYVTSWIDNMGTGIMVFKGNIGKGGKMISKADYNNPMTGKMEKHKIVITPGEGGHAMDYYVIQEGSDEKVQMMHIDYTKVEAEEEMEVEEEIEINKE